MAFNYSYKGKRPDWNVRPNPYLPVRTETVQYPKKRSRDKNLESIARAVHDFPGEKRWYYTTQIPADYINTRLFYINVDHAIAVGLIFMVNWRLYPSPLWDFDLWQMAEISIIDQFLIKNP